MNIIPRGGIVGFAYTCSIEYVYNIGVIAIISDSTNRGGAIGFAVGSNYFTDCFFLEGCADLSSGVGVETSMSEIELKDPLTYSIDWGTFGSGPIDTWNIDPSVNEGYPYLVALYVLNL